MSDITTGMTNDLTINELANALAKPDLFCQVIFGFKPTSYQYKFLYDDSKRVVIRASRQSGKSWILAAYAIIYAITHENKQILVVSPSLRQSMLLTDKVDYFINKIPPILKSLWIEKIQRTRTTFRNHSKIDYLPNSVDLLRGYTADLIIVDEAAFFKDDEEVIYNVLLPMFAVTNGKIVIGSTPWGKKSVFYKLCQDKNWSNHYINWQDAIREHIYDPDFVKTVLMPMQENEPVRFEMEFCYHKDTEYLTENGWKKWTQIKDGEKIGCYDPITEHLVYHLPLSRTKVWADKLITYGTKNKIVFAVTPHHNIYCVGNGNKNKTLKFIKAKDACKTILVKDSLKWRGTEIDKIKIPKKMNLCLDCGNVWNLWKSRGMNKRECKKCWSYNIKTVEGFDEYQADDFLKILGYIISEGCIPSKDYVSLAISQKISDKELIMSKTLDKYFKFYISNQKYRGKEYKMKVWIKEDRWLIRWLRKNVGTYSSNKHIPQEFLNLSERQLKILFDAIILGDGWHQRQGIYFYSVSKALLDNMMELGLKLGYSVNFVKDGHTISFCKYGLRTLKKGEICYNDYAYCFTVPTGILVTRYNGRISIQGNCANFIEDIDSFFTSELILNCLDSEPVIRGSDANYYPFEHLAEGNFYIGVDFGKHRDFSVVAVVKRTGDTGKLVHLHQFPLETPYASVMGYIKTLCDRLKYVNSIHVDMTGIGDYIVEDMKTLGLPRIEGISLSVPSKENIMNRLKSLMLENKIKIPYDRELINEINAEKYVLSKTGHLLFSHNEGAHDDRLWALALAVEGAFEYTPISVSLGKGIFAPE